ncbi:hypothetical protein [Thioalkalivibrio sp. XN279]|uniref:hypothetical protein n=1 Tax=Thioalkalivibrio sp. XN279 TaxID=2714953 RepID=UPI001407DEE5|nr:hypothetical protein [Thioalkalivibrio sp. XN279]NHA14147.1 hypothetical protein [Thioalkalivibrio sp. XN279]
MGKRGRRDEGLFGHNSLGDKLRALLFGSKKDSRKDTAKEEAKRPIETVRRSADQVEPARERLEQAREARPDSRHPHLKGSSKAEIVLPEIAPCHFEMLRERPEAPRHTGPRGARKSIRLKYGSGPETDLVIGIDLGTSCTKIVVRDAIRDEAFGVPIGELSGFDSAYLCPSRISISQTGTLRLEPAGLSIWDFKTRLVKFGDTLFRLEERFPEATALEMTTAYLALVLTHTLWWIEQQLGRRLEKTAVTWHLNVGIPTNQLHVAHSATPFRIALLAGWILAEQGPTDITLCEVRTALAEVDSWLAAEDEQAWRPRHHISRDFVHAFPEIVAEVSGYARSKIRKAGLHFIMDVGAGTVDLATFNLVDRPDGDAYAIFLTKVYSLGTARLLSYRQNALDSILGKDSDRDEIVNKALFGGAGMTSSLPDLNTLAPSLSAERRPEVDSGFISMVRSGCAQILLETKANRIQDAYQWENGLPVFICGGGSLEPVYLRSLKLVESTFTPAKQGFRYIDLQMPDQFYASGLAPAMFHRLAVANGLAYRHFDIGEPIPPSEIPDLKRRDIPELLGGAFVRKEDV